MRVFQCPENFPKIGWYKVMYGGDSIILDRYWDGKCWACKPDYPTYFPNERYKLSSLNQLSTQEEKEE